MISKTLLLATNMGKISKQHNAIVYLSTYPPRECGIGTFTQDLTNALDRKFNPATKSRVVAVNESPTSIYNYGNKASEQIIATSLDHYVTLAERINKEESIKLVNIQHEFGIFGGEWGDYLIPFLQVVKKPVVTTFHTVLTDPPDFAKNLVQFIGEKSKAIVVMNELSRKTLEGEYGIPKSKIHLIPHGIPETTFESSDKYKAELGLEGKTVLATFGMLNRDKGIEYAIRALPKAIEQFPNLVYLVLGATHPVVRRNDGEWYRNFLYDEVERLNLKDHVRFYDKYLSLEEIITYLKATDIYLSPTLNPRQSVSGTLSYALGCGRPAVSTETAYAKHLIVDGETGLLVKFRSSQGIARALISLLSDGKQMQSMNQAAYESTRKMIWPNVASEYFHLYQKFADLETEEDKVPAIKLDHLVRLTDNFGVLHHAKYSKPEKRYGYSLDDNARALIVAAKSYILNPNPGVILLMTTYLRFIKFAQRPTGSFSNIINSKGQKDGSTDEDVQGRALWALGYVVSESNLPKEIRKAADPLFQKALKNLSLIESPRATAFAMTGLYHYLKRSPKKKLRTVFEKLAKRELDLYRNHASPEWQWPEDNLTYSNSKLPEALFYAYDLTKRKEYLHAAQATLKFLTNVTFGPHYYMPIGQNGWYFRYNTRAYYDQQPEDAASMVETKIAAYKITKDKRYLEDAFKAFQWFLGKNHLGQMVYNEVTGGCYDGVGREAINLNQGAESTISYLLARLAVEDQGAAKMATA